jgi:hypothetical protein
MPTRATATSMLPHNSAMLIEPMRRSARQDIFPHFMGTDIGSVDIPHCVSGNTGCRSAGSHRTEVARIRDESEQRAINGIADHDAALFTRLHLRRSVASGSLVAQRDADINLVIRAMAGPSVDRQHGCVHGAGAEQVQGLLAGLGGGADHVGRFSL